MSNRSTLILFAAGAGDSSPGQCKPGSLRSCSLTYLMPVGTPRQGEAPRTADRFYLSIIVWHYCSGDCVEITSCIDPAPLMMTCRALLAFLSGRTQLGTISSGKLDGSGSKDTLTFDDEQNR